MTVQLELFTEESSGDIHGNFHDIKGLQYFPSLLSHADQMALIQEIDQHPWLNDLKRRVQHYGYKYDYKARRVDPSMFVGALPRFANEIAQKLLDHGMIDEFPDQLIVNEYQPGQGISAHVDCQPCFKSVIATVSLGSVYEIDFIHVATGRVVSMPLELGSALVFRDEARYEWMHRIRSRSREKWGPRGRRISLTFRNVILQHSEDL